LDEFDVEVVEVVDELEELEQPARSTRVNAEVATRAGVRNEWMRIRRS
jgi:hypothetical protein